MGPSVRGGRGDSVRRAMAAGIGEADDGQEADGVRRSAHRPVRLPDEGAPGARCADTRERLASRTSRSSRSRTTSSASTACAADGASRAQATAGTKIVARRTARRRSTAASPSSQSETLVVRAGSRRIMIVTVVTGPQADIKQASRSRLRHFADGVSRRLNAVEAGQPGGRHGSGHLRPHPLCEAIAEAPPDPPGMHGEDEPERRADDD